VETTLSGLYVTDDSRRARVIPDQYIECMRAVWLGGNGSIVIEEQMRHQVLFLVHKIAKLRKHILRYNQKKVKLGKSFFLNT